MSQDPNVFTRKLSYPPALVEAVAEDFAAFHPSMNIMAMEQLTTIHRKLGRPDAPIGQHLAFLKQIADMIPGGKPKVEQQATGPMFTINIIPPSGAEPAKVVANPLSADRKRDVTDVEAKAVTAITAEGEAALQSIRELVGTDNDPQPATPAAADDDDMDINFDD